MVTNKVLLILHGVAALFQFIQASYTAGLSNTTFKNKGRFFITNGDKTSLPSYHIGNLIAVFPFLAGVDHLWSVVDSKRYFSFVQQGYNPVRWLEYSISAGLMLFVIAQLSDVTDIKLLVLILCGNIILQYFGYSSELNAARGDYGQAKKDNGVGFGLFVSLWIPLFVAFFTSLTQAEESPPEMVYVIIFVMFALFLVFGLLNYGYVTGKYARLKDFKNVELGYLVLSFVSKTLLTNLTLFGALNKPPTTEEFLQKSLQN